MVGTVHCYLSFLLCIHHFRGGQSDNQCTPRSQSGQRYPKLAMQSLAGVGWRGLSMTWRKNLLNTSWCFHFFVRFFVKKIRLGKKKTSPKPLRVGSRSTIYLQARDVHETVHNVHATLTWYSRHPWRPRFSTSCGNKSTNCSPIPPNKLSQKTTESGHRSIPKTTTWNILQVDLEKMILALKMFFKGLQKGFNHWDLFFNGSQKKANSTIESRTRKIEAPRWYPIQDVPTSTPRWTMVERWNGGFPRWWWVTQNGKFPIFRLVKIATVMWSLLLLPPGTFGSKIFMLC